MGLQVRRQAFRDIAGQKLGGGVLDGEQHTVFPREEPFALAVANAHAPLACLYRNQLAPSGQQHAVIELVDDRLGSILEGDEIEDVEIAVERPLDLDGGT